MMAAGGGGGFVSLLVVSSMPVAELLLIGVAGAYLATARCGNVLTPSARADINRVVYAVFTPALMLASLASTVTLKDVLAWWFMPVNIGIAFLAGGALGWVAVLVLRPPPQLRGLVIASCSAANFGNLLLVVIPAVCEEDGNPFGLPNNVCTEHGLSYASFSMALGGLYIWTHTHGIIKRSGEIYRKMREPIVGISAVTSVVVEPNDDDDSLKSEEYNTISPSSKPKGQHQILVPLLSGSSVFHHHQQGSGSKSLWQKIKQVTHQITEELTSPPTTGAVMGLVIGTVPWLRSVFVGSNAPLRAVQDSLKLFGDKSLFEAHTRREPRWLFHHDKLWEKVPGHPPSFPRSWPRKRAAIEALRLISAGQFLDCLRTARSTIPKPTRFRISSSAAACPGAGRPYGRRYESELPRPGAGGCALLWVATRRWWVAAGRVWTGSVTAGSRDFVTMSQICDCSLPWQQGAKLLDGAHSWCEGGLQTPLIHDNCSPCGRRTAGTDEHSKLHRKLIVLCCRLHCGLLYGSDSSSDDKTINRVKL